VSECDTVSTLGATWQVARGLDIDLEGDKRGEHIWVMKTHIAVPASKLEVDSRCDSNLDWDG
jgi:hypothetical protein